MTTFGFPHPLKTATVSETTGVRKACPPVQGRREVTFQVGRGSSQEKVGSFRPIGCSPAVPRVQRGTRDHTWGNTRANTLGLFSSGGRSDLPNSTSLRKGGMCFLNWHVKCLLTCILFPSKEFIVQDSKSVCRRNV